MSNILDHFPSGYTPSDIQTKVLLELQRRWNSSRVFVLNLEVASGKSFLAHTIAEWAAANSKGAGSGARICTPTTVLVDQYARDFKDTPVIKSAGHYTCDTRKAKCGAFAANSRCRGCVYNKARMSAASAPVSISTYHMQLALRSRRNLMIFDEAHNLPAKIREMHSHTIWAHRVRMPEECVGDFTLTKEWLNSLEDSYFEELSGQDGPVLRAFKHDLNEPNRALNFYTWGSNWWAGGGTAWGDEMSRGERYELPQLNIIPIEVFDKPPVFWDDRHKLVLMSATIGRPDLHELGLDRDRPVFIEGDSPIPPNNRPIFKDYVGRINYRSEDRLLDDLAAKLKHYLDTKEGRGVIHITYGLAKKLTKILSHDRLITHTRSNMRDQLKSFLKTDSGVFLASGMYEGVSLDYDKARWQAISKIAWPSLTDPLQNYRSKDEPDYYNWTTLKTVIQTAGRVCRRPDDYGETFVLDESFEKLLKCKHLIPKSFSDRIRGHEV